MKPLECPSGGGPHRWKPAQRGIVCDRCGLPTSRLTELREARMHKEFARRMDRAHERRGAIYIPLGERPVPKIVVVPG